MATHARETDLAQALGLGVERHPVAAARIFAQFDRAQLEGFIAVAIDVLDAIDGDSDVELNGDELDGTSTEEDIPGDSCGDLWIGAGCPLGDPDEEA